MRLSCTVSCLDIFCANRSNDSCQSLGRSLEDTRELRSSACTKRSQKAPLSVNITHFYRDIQAEECLTHLLVLWFTGE